MKRRIFLSSLLASTTVFLLPLCLPASNKRSLFARFFTVANDSPPNSHQLKLFNAYMAGKQSLTSPRRVGMTTFMLTLALFKTRCNGISIRLFAQNLHINRICLESVKIMEARLRKAVADGKITWAHNLTHARGVGSSAVKTFTMSDGGRLPETYNSRICNFRDEHFFGSSGFKNFTHST